MNIYVGNLNYRIKEEDLKNVFEDYGQVESVKIITDKMSGRSKGFAFVEMQDDAEARAAMEALHESEFEGRKMIVNEARPRREFNDR
ncbi:MAG: RNA-binding protein [Salinivirgaceae bacterium]|jgi:RNA recognition motif-containing protein|nr:MAG: RNA-binding protein [Salinivirgaceae bacterium]